MAQGNRVVGVGSQSRKPRGEIRQLVIGLSSRYQATNPSSAMSIVGVWSAELNNFLIERISG